MPNITFRDTVRSKLPTWLLRGLNEKYLLAQHVMFDALGDGVVQAVQQWFPGFLDFQSLKLLGRQRRIPRGRYESDEVYAQRLQQWLGDHQQRGGPYALLDQLHIHYSPNAFPIDLIYRNGRRFQMAADGTVTTDIVSSWNPDGHPELWARVTLIYYTDQFEPDPDLDDIRLIPTSWNAAHVSGRIIVVSGPVFDALDDVETFDGGSVTFDEPGTSTTLELEYGT